MDISDSQARLIRDCVTEMVLRRQRLGVPIPDRVRGLLAYVSAAGHQTVCGETQSRQDADDYIRNDEAADILGCSTRHARRLAADLDGRKFGREWMFSRHTVVEYANARRTPCQTPSSAA